MNTLVCEPLAKSVTFARDTMWVALEDGRQLGVPVAYFPRLFRATTAQRKNYTLSGGGSSIHWDDLDEDISVPALLMGIGDRSRKTP